MGSAWGVHGWCMVNRGRGRDRDRTSRAHLLEVTIDGVGELDDLLVDTIHHGGGSHVLLVAQLLLGGRHLVGCGVKARVSGQGGGEAVGVRGRLALG